MPKVLYIPIAAAILLSAGCAQQPRAIGGLPAGAHTASTDWTLPEGSLAQNDDEEDDDAGPSLEDRARQLFGDKPLRGTLPAMSSIRSSCSSSSSPKSPGSAGNVQRAAAGLRGARQATREPRSLKRATELAAYSGACPSLPSSRPSCGSSSTRTIRAGAPDRRAVLVANHKLSEAKPYPAGADLRQMGNT
jgi:hypothetical protein